MEVSLHLMWMHDLKATAHVLEAAVATVAAAAAAQTGQRQPSTELVGACFIAVSSLLGADVLQQRNSAWISAVVHGVCNSH
jgi:uncharacterized membrane protein YfcA